MTIKSAGGDSERSTLPNTGQASGALSFLEISCCPLQKRCSVSCGSISYKTQPNHSPVGLLGQMLHVHPYGMLEYVLMFHRLFT